jgi:hypothetical protein
MMAWNRPDLSKKASRAIGSACTCWGLIRQRRIHVHREVLGRFRFTSE